MGVQHIFISAYRPQANGQVERFNRTILARLRALVGEGQGKWDLYSSAVTYAYNTQVHASTGYSPFDRIISRPPPPAGLAFTSDSFPVPNLQSAVVQALFADLVVGIPIPETHALRARLRHRLALQLPRVRARLELAGRGYKRHADRHVHGYDPDHLVGKRVAL
jgi:transposase InsO family protein